MVRGGETILQVEDEPAILRMTTMMLERMGYAVIGAKTPGEAIRLAQEHKGRIDLLRSPNGVRSCNDTFTKRKFNI